MQGKQPGSEIKCDDNIAGATNQEANLRSNLCSMRKSGGNIQQDNADYVHVELMHAACEFSPGTVPCTASPGALINRGHGGTVEFKVQSALGADSDSTAVRASGRAEVVDDEDASPRRGTSEAACGPRRRL